jgi:predicted acylesterase/phospholipase RssA
MRGRSPPKAILAIALCAGLAAGCATAPREPPLTIAQSRQVLVLGIPNARFQLGDAQQFEAELRASAQREIDTRHRAGQDGPLPPAEFLAISGGGDQGAFGAGLLVGWTAHGDRPTFKAVTGVSTGALSAPFAFLGPEYDPQLKAIYTEITARSVFKPNGLLTALFGEAATNTAPLRATISRYLDATVLQRIAEEYRKGRLLLVMSTNLDAPTPCIWNIGAIAASGRPGAREMIIKILLASSAIPSLFPPVMFDFDVDGQRHQEMHVDGGVFAQTFLYPPAIDFAATEKAAGTVGRQRDAYIIRNSTLLPEATRVERGTIPIARRTVSIIVGASGVNDMIRLYATSREDNVGYHLAYIDDDFTTPYKGPFDQTYMRTLFQYGFAQGLGGVEWKDKPPGQE